MPPSSPIAVPAGYAPAVALGYADPAGNLALVAEASPLPVQIVNDETGTAPQPLAGSAGGTLLAGPFLPLPNTPVTLSLWGAWQGTVQLERAADSDAPRLPTTVAGGAWGRFTANACEPVWTESAPGAELYLAIAVTSGTLNYRLAQ